MTTTKDKSMALTSTSATPDRHRVDLSTPDLARHWCKHFGKSKESIEAAIAKVGDNAETVMKELGLRSKQRSRPPE
jgi:hypothetical protein